MLSISQVIVSSGGSGAFSASGNCNHAMLQPGVACAVSVTFKPSVAGTPYAGELDFSANAAGSHVVALRGTATSAPDPRMTRGQITFTTDPGAALSEPVSVQNYGSAPFTVASVNPTGAGAQDFTVNPDGCSRTSVKPADECDMSVEYTGPVGGSAEATLVVTFDEHAPETATLAAHPSNPSTQSSQGTDQSSQSGTSNPSSTSTPTTSTGPSSP